MNDFRVSFNKYVFPVILLTLGVILIAVGFKQMAHDSRLYRFLLGAIGIFLVGILSLYYSMGKISNKFQRILIIPAVLLCVFFGKANYDTIQENIEYEAIKKDTRNRVIQKFKDIRTAQQAYRDANGNFAGNFNDLVSFTKNGTVPIFKSIGAIPDSLNLEEAMELGMVVKMPDGMSDEEAAAQGLIVRDTVYASVLRERFQTPKALSKRKFPLNLDSLKFSPYKGMFSLEISSTEVTGGLRRPTLLLQESHPYPGTDTLRIGSLSEAHLNGNWKE